MALFVALVIAVIGGVVVILTGNFKTANIWMPLLGGAVLLFAITFVIVYYTLQRFIYQKISPIYKTITSVPLTEKQIRRELEQKDAIKEVNDQVIDYAKRKAKEIKKLKQLEQYRKEFLGNVSHELKTPIFNIQGYILTLLDGGLEDTSINHEYLERTEKSINRMISIVEDLESISRLESGELILDYGAFDIVQLAKDVIEEQEMRAKKAKVKLKLVDSSDKPVMVYADRKRIFEVVNNLVVNSINYSNEGGKTLISFHDMGDNILVDVSDDGIGIAPNEIPRIFERFYRTDKSRSRDQGGTGLGLSIVKHIIEAHHQTINVRSTPDTGSSFAFTLKKA